MYEMRAILNSCKLPLRDQTPWPVLQVLILWAVKAGGQPGITHVVVIGVGAGLIT